MVDHTLLKPEATPDDISSLCAEANLPLRMQDDTTNLEKEANPDA